MNGIFRLQHQQLALPYPMSHFIWQMAAWTSRFDNNKVICLLLWEGIEEIMIKEKVSFMVMKKGVLKISQPFEKNDHPLFSATLSHTTGYSTRKL